MELERGEGELALFDSRSELCLKRSCLLLGDFVLDRDVRARFVQILVCEVAVKMFGYQRPEGKQLRALQRNRGPLSEVEQSGDPRYRLRKFARHLWQKVGQFVEQRRREGMKQGDVSVEMISLGREVSPA